MRERRAADLLPVDGQAPRDAARLVAPAVEATLRAPELAEADAAAAQLARHLAKTMDEASDPAWAARWLGPNLLATLESLGATPVARARLKPKLADRPPSQLDKLRAARPRDPA